jgi:thiosulfate reductase cytochrome b subunit
MQVNDLNRGAGVTADSLHSQAHLPQVPRHPLFVRVTHWINAASFLALVLSGLAILLAYPRLHWGETGTVGTPAIINLPLPFVLDLGIRGPGRSLHFMAAWISLFTGLTYAISGLWSGHFRREFCPKKSALRFEAVRKVTLDHLRLRRPTEEKFASYNLLQQLSYIAVVFVLYPFMFVTGLAMSPAFTSVFPCVVKVFGGFQSARTLHFFAASFLVMFLFVHIFMVILAGFVRGVRAMITGYPTSRSKRA